MPVALRFFCFCQSAMAPAKLGEDASKPILNVWLMSESYKYQPCCCLLPKVQVRSVRSEIFCIDASANDAMGRAALAFGTKTVGFTNDSVFCGGAGDCPRIERVAIVAMPTATRMNAAVKGI